MGYEPASKTLEVEFRDGAIYQYYGIPSIIYTGLLSASSVGQYLDTHIKKRGYAYRRVE